MDARHLQLAADAVLALHALVPLFLVGGLLAVWLGAWRGWRWVRHRGFRTAHVALMAFVAAQALLGRLCPLTLLEEELRQRAGEAGYGGGFIAHWVGRWLYWEVPAWVFGALYAALLGLMVLTWWRVPPRAWRPAR
ncbi:MAG TPA: DUF2784 domain-containing protein [Verrucomicrobiota bacterium]|nr:DUF2784 domain-containing protein [Verrucomicrobiota bacterium]